MGVIDTSSVTAYEDYIANHVQLLKQQRDYRSADYFIFSAAVTFEKMDPVVVGRYRIDNYLISYIFKVGGSLVDCTNRVIGIHQGLDGYKEHTRSGKKLSDLEWNRKWTGSIQKIKGAMMYADYKFSRRDWRSDCSRIAGNEYTRKIMMRMHERRNIVRMRKSKMKKLLQSKV